MPSNSFKTIQRAILSATRELTAEEAFELIELLENTSGPALPFARYHVWVDYEKPISTLIAEGNFRKLDPKITDENFPREKMGRQLLTFYLVKFNRDISTKAARNDLDSLGLRPATISELLSFITTFTSQGDALIALGSSFTEVDNDLSGTRVPVVYCDKSFLSLTWQGGIWLNSGDWTFLAIPK